MKKTFFGAVFALSALLMMAQSSTAEARHHHCCHNRTNVQVGLGIGSPCRDAYVVRRYAQPVAPVYVAPVPGYYAPVYMVPAPYVEEVYVAPAYRPSFGGLSFSWNFFR